MALTYQYNKTELQRLNKQLSIRQKALPILKNKEAALRMEVKKAKREADLLQKQLHEKMEAAKPADPLWSEFDFDLLDVKTIKHSTQKIAGVSISVFEQIEYNAIPYSLFNQPAWFPAGMALLKEWTGMAVRRTFMMNKMTLLDQVRKKTTQKVNLYEKVQIPAFEEAVKKIKRVLEDEENLAKAAQKIIKTKQL